VNTLKKARKDSLTRWYYTTPYKIIRNPSYIWSSKINRYHKLVHYDEKQNLAGRCVNISTDKSDTLLSSQRESVNLRDDFIG